MNLEDKMYWTVIYGVGVFLSYFFIVIVDKQLKRRMNVTGNHWFFSSTKLSFIKWVMTVMYIVLVILIWTNVFIVPEHR